MRKSNLIPLFTVLILASCKTETPQNNTQTPPPSTSPVAAWEKVSTPEFNADSAYSFIEKQVSFGPRVPNTKEHVACAKYLSNKLRSYGLEVYEQKGMVKAFNDKNLNIINIIGQINPKATNRVMLFAHWDSRPYADRDTKNQSKAILGANDGASGVGVIMEIARQIALAEQKPNIGVDVIFFDAEDYGQPRGTMVQEKEDTWCLGAQYWVANKFPENYAPKYGILLDMVGAENATFPREGWSTKYASSVVSNIWNVAKNMGYGDKFVNLQMMGGITDDHLYINESGIPAVDIVHYDPYKNDFGSFHHTHADDMTVINKNTLSAVGNTLMQVLYREP